MPSTRSGRRTRPACSPRVPSAMAGRDPVFVLDMFPYPSGAGLHVGHPLGYIGTDVYARFERMNGKNVLHAMGYDVFGLPAEQYAVQTGQHPQITTEANIANMRRQLRALGLGHDSRRGPATTDPGYYRWTQWIFLQIFESWYDVDADRARPISELVPRLEADPEVRVGRARRAIATRAGRLVPARVPAGGTGQLVPRARHGARQRGGHRRGSQRAWELPGVPAPAEAVDDADHRVRGSAARGPRAARLDRFDQVDATKLDRAQRRCLGRLRRRGSRRPHHGVHHPPGHAVRCDLHGARARAPTRRHARAERVARRDARRADVGRPGRVEGDLRCGGRPRGGRPAVPRVRFGQERAGTPGGGQGQDRACSPAPSRSTP